MTTRKVCKFLRRLPAAKAHNQTPAPAGDKLPTGKKRSGGYYKNTGRERAEHQARLYLMRDRPNERAMQNEKRIGFSTS